MLLRIREVTAGKFSYFIVALITVPLALWGISYYFQGAFDPVVIEIDPVEVTLSEFNQKFNERKRDISSNTSESQMPPDDAITQDVIGHFIREGLLAHDINEYRYRIPDSVLADNILSMSEFWSDNRFDRELYARGLKARRISRSGFEENIRNTLLQGKLRRVIEESSFILPYEDIAYEQFLFEERRGRYLELPIAAYVKSDDIPATRTEVYYVENEEKFATSDRFALEYIELSLEKVTSEVVVEAYEVRSYYDGNMELFSLPQRRKFAHILIDPDRHGDSGAEDRANEIHEKLRQGEAFSELAEEYSDDDFTAQAGGELPPLSRDDLDEEIAEVVFALNAGDFSEPVESRFGLQIFKLLEIEPAVSRSFEEVRDEIHASFEADLARRVYDETIEQLRFLAYEYPDSLDEVANQVEAVTVAVKSTSPLNVNRREGIFQYPEIARAVYGNRVLELGENSRVIEISNGHAFVVRIAEGGYQVGRQKGFEEVEDEVVEILRKEDAWKDAGVAARKMLQRLQEKEITLDELAREHSLEIEDIDFVRRDDRQLYLGILRALFLMPRVAGSHTLGITSNTAYAVIELLEMRRGEFLPEEKQELNRGLEEYRIVLNAMLEKVPVEIDSETILDKGPGGS